MKNSNYYLFLLSSIKWIWNKNYLVILLTVYGNRSLIRLDCGTATTKNSVQDIKTQVTITSVSYTHLDVYKRQVGYMDRSVFIV